MEVQLKCAEYFKSINALAKKIGDDLDEARTACCDIWDNLDEERKKEILNNAIVDSDAILKYSQTPGSWSGEKNSTFSWFTKSQLNLFTYIKVDSRNERNSNKNYLKNQNNIIKGMSIADKKQSIKSPPCEPNNLFERLKNRMKVRSPELIKTNGEDTQCLVSPTSTDSSSSGNLNVINNNVSVNAKSNKIVAKPKTPPPPPPNKRKSGERQSLLSNNSDLEDPDIPKTGFDFLDNW